ncbi:MAG: response regulator transcription factor, partial [Gammaproteobacteria bacterium]|nr:response regulator transcription factor [Gammaproteobacteria bacterium]
MKSSPVALVIDNQEVFEFIKPALSKTLNTTQIIHCKTHQDAMSYIASDQQADIIIADWTLTGYIFLESVRSDLENHNTPVIIMSEDTNIKKIILNNVESKATF